jgi:hypothetical protein
MRLSRSLLLFGIVSAALGVSSCNLCSTDQLSEKVSSGGVATAFVFENGCGATVRDSRQVTLTLGAETPKRGLFESVIEEGTVFRIEGEALIEVQWIAKDSVKISYRKQSPSDRIFKAEREWRGIRVIISESSN